MKRILILICLLLFCLCGCQNKSGAKSNEPQKQVVVFPSEQTAATLNGYKDATDDNASYGAIEYIGNSNSKKFHLSDCRYAKNIKQENIVTEFDRNKMINSGYAPCQTCNP